MPIVFYYDINFIYAKDKFIILKKYRNFGLFLLAYLCNVKTNKLKKMLGINSLKFRCLNC